MRGMAFPSAGLTLAARRGHQRHDVALEGLQPVGESLAQQHGAVHRCRRVTRKREVALGHLRRQRGDRQRPGVGSMPKMFTASG